MVLILYGFVVFLATLLGSFVGLGGGVIIKPVSNRNFFLFVLCCFCDVDNINYTSYH